jgi:hypothetical protein
MSSEQRLAFIWDYNISERDFLAMLAGELTIGRLGQDWAAVRLLEYATYAEIIRLLGFRRLIEGWPRWRARVRSENRVRGFDFLVKWLPEYHPELLSN